MNSAVKFQSWKQQIEVYQWLPARASRQSQRNLPGKPMSMLKEHLVNALVDWDPAKGTGYVYVKGAHETDMVLERRTIWKMKQW